MPYSCRRVILALLALICVFFLRGAFAQDNFPFTGQVDSDNINIRADSTVTSDQICNVKKGQYVEVVLELYGWYKIRLPKNAPSFIKKDLVSVVEDLPADSFDKIKNSAIVGSRVAKIIKEKVNIRLKPNEASAILGKASKNEIVTVVEDKGDWLKIEPVNNSFGWINKKFVTKVSEVKKIEEENKPAAKADASENSVAVEGVIRPYGMIFKRIATHKLITADNKIFLLKGDKKSLDALNYHKVKVSGKVIGQEREKFPVIEINKIEGMD